MAKDPTPLPSRFPLRGELNAGIELEPPSGISRTVGGRDGFLDLSITPDQQTAGFRRSSCLRFIPQAFQQGP